MFSNDSFKRVVKRAGLTKGEVATLYGVSRQTVYDWLSDPPAAPHVGSPMERMADTITAALLVNIEKGVLPMPAVSRDVRVTRVARMRRTLQNLKPAPR